MHRSIVRLELIKLTYAHGRDSAEAVGRAKVLEAYVLEPEDQSTGARPEKTEGGEAGQSRQPQRGRLEVGKHYREPSR